MSLIGTTAVTQGPQGTIHLLSCEMKEGILKFLRNFKDLLDLLIQALPACPAKEMEMDWSCAPHTTSSTITSFPQVRP